MLILSRLQELNTKMSDEIKKIIDRMEQLETLIKETKNRLPAHSVKPPGMMDLLDYEDEYQTLLDRLNRLKDKWKN